MSRYGTAHFTATRCAVAYFGQQGYTADDVQEKIEEGEIKIGRPESKSNETVSIDRDGRYWIEG